MYLPNATRRRLPTIKTMLLTGNNYDTIGKKCGVTGQTIDRDMAAWYKSWEYESWIFQEWLRLHAEVLKEDCVEPYRQVSKLFAKMVIRKAEIKTDTTITERKEVTFSLDTLNHDERELIKSVARRYIKSSDTAGSSSIH